MRSIETEGVAARAAGRGPLVVFVVLVVLNPAAAATAPGPIRWAAGARR
jgi:hypothetical protein